MSKDFFCENDCPCPLDICYEDGALVIRGTTIKVSYVLERLATGTSLEQLVKEHEEITGEALALILLIASRLFDKLPIETIYAIVEPGGS